MKIIKVSEKFLTEPKIKVIFKSDIGIQLYLQIATTHIRSQYFNDAILDVMRHLQKMKTLPNTVRQMRDILMEYGQHDAAVSHAFRSPSMPFFYNKVAEGSCGNWREYNQERDNERAKHQVSIDEADAGIMSIVKAINGREPWNFEIV